MKELTKEEQIQIKKNLTEMIKTEIFHMTDRQTIMKMIRKELRKEIKEHVDSYLQQIMPDSIEISEIIRQVFLAMGAKKKK